MPHFLARRHILRIAATLPMAALGARAFAAAAPLKIGFIGAGRMATGLGKAWAKAGHEVMFSSRHPETLKDLVAATGPKARAGTVKESVAFGDIIVLTVPYAAVPDIAAEFSKQIAAKQLVIDVSNPIERRDGEIADKILTEGPAEYLTRLIPGIKLARAFNAIGFNTLDNPPRPEGGPQGVAVVANDPKVIALTEQLVREVGFEPVIVGPLSKGKYLYGTYGKFGGVLTPTQVREIGKTLP